MLEPNRVKQIEKFNNIQDLGNDNYYYNYDIKPDILLANDIDNQDIPGFSAIQVYIHGKPDYKTCVRAVIRAYVTQDEEFDLINSYNQTNLNQLDDTNAKKEYIDYLKLLSDIKKEVKNTFNKL